MKKNILLICMLIGLISCNFEAPTRFSEEALNDTLISTEGEIVSLKSVLNQYKGKKILIDVWATWCKDCIVGMPVVKALQQEFKDVEFLFLSEDRSEAAWKRGIDKYDIKGTHYFIKEGANGPFADFLNSNWIPRYLVIDKEGKIKLFKAKKATDQRIKEALQ